MNYRQKKKLQRLIELREAEKKRIENKRRYDDYHNAEGYADPTAHAAMRACKNHTYGQN